jgi:hypothetical protein
MPHHSYHVFFGDLKDHTEIAGESGSVQDKNCPVQHVIVKSLRELIEYDYFVKIEATLANKVGT